MKRTPLPIILFAFLCAACSTSVSVAQAQLLGRWKFSASCETPSTTLDGLVNIVYDSASFVVGGVHLEKKVLPFHGRHFGNRFIARTDTGHYPVIRIDCHLDSARTTMSGVLTVSKIRAKEPKKKAKDYYDVLYQLYFVREDS